MKNIKKLLLGVIGIVFILILTGSYLNNYNLLKEPPSETWSKEVEIGVGSGKNSPVLIKEENRLLTAYEASGKLKICETDLNAKVIRTVDYDIEEDFLKNMIFLKSDTGYILMYNSSKASKGYLEKITLDKDLNLVSREIIEGVDATYQADDSNVVFSYEDKLEVLNTITNKSVSVPSTKVSDLTASANKDGIQVCYIKNESDIGTFSVKDGVASPPVLVTTLPKRKQALYNNLASSSDGKNVYILVEEWVNGAPSSTKLIEFSIAGGDAKISKLSVNSTNYVVNAKGSYSDDGGKFYATMHTEFGKKEVQESIVSFEIKDGKSSNLEIVTRLSDLCIRPYITDGYSTFLSFNKKNVYDINIASTNQEFKNVNNEPRFIEFIRALFAMLEGVMESISYIILIGIYWIIPILVVGSVVTYYDYTFSNRRKQLSYIILAAMSILLKTYIIIDTFYKTYSYMLPTIMAPISVGLTLCILIGLIVYTYGYFVYIDDLECIFLGNFGIFMMIDTILTLMIFVPLIA
ncbi:MAG: hypothetical protein RSA29_03815 [Clostridium sp.]|uniref:hypothetical protein n=1 Tax=Clostridium sp. TaxID=1506 RepID=UPI0030337673